MNKKNMFDANKYTLGDTVSVINGLKGITNRQFFIINKFPFVVWRTVNEVPYVMELVSTCCGTGFNEEEMICDSCHEHCGWETKEI